MGKENIYIIKEQKCDVGNIILRSDKILMFIPFDGVTTCNLKNLKEMYAIFMDLTNGIPHLYYSDNTNLKSFGSEERVYVSATFHDFALACAIKENSAIVRFITHSMVYLNKPKIPIKMFKTEKDSFKWLKSL
ncbi:MAG: hypothetical protein JKX68_09120 [Flavobacteriales bacterium]|nr:hypothetical protein [Flavobacteriales bacterium]